MVLTKKLPPQSLSGYAMYYKNNCNRTTHV